MKLEVASRKQAATEVCVITFRHPRRPSLPAATAGAHVDLRLPDGRIRQYSLCGDPADLGTYRIAVKREEGGRGGSAWIHENLTPGTVVLVSAPRNHFPLAAGGRHHVLIGGGIGVTPLISMAHQLRQSGDSFEMHYCSRSDHPVLLDELESVCERRLFLHQGTARGGRLDAQALLADYHEGTHVYCCGPHPLMQAVRSAVAEWPHEAVHFEAFQPLLDESFVPDEFEVELARTRKLIPVPADKSALDALRAHGVDLPSSCEIGVCGSCECGLIAGDAVHRDVVLGYGARGTRFIPCVSRGHGRIVLDL